MQSDEVLERRIQKEAERLGEPVDAARQRLIEVGLDASRERRELNARAKDLTVDVVLVTATMTEHRQLRDVARAFGIPFEKRQGRFGPYFHLGKVGNERVASIQVQMGAFGAEGAAARCIQARAETHATMFVLLGTAFGVNPARQRIGDVLVSESVFLYDDRHAVDGQTPGRVATGLEILGRLADRATPETWMLARRLRTITGPGYTISYPTARRPASVAWVARFRRLAEELHRAGEDERVVVGTILSGGALIESACFRDELVARLPAMDPPVVGGEMEAMGAMSAAAADAEEPGWIVVKSIVDFADAPSRANAEAHRDGAARSSARAVLRALHLPAISP